jgi:hypothetical protein
VAVAVVVADAAVRAVAVPVVVVVAWRPRDAAAAVVVVDAEVRAAAEGRKVVPGESGIAANATTSLFNLLRDSRDSLPGTTKIGDGVDGRVVRCSRRELRVPVPYP